MKFKAKTDGTFERMPKILRNNFSFKEHPISSNRFNEFFEQKKFGVRNVSNKKFGFSPKLIVIGPGFAELRISFLMQ